MRIVKAFRGPCHLAPGASLLFCEVRSRKVSSRLSACVLEILQGTNNELFFRERLEIPGDIYIFNTVLFTQSP